MMDQVDGSLSTGAGKVVITKPRDWAYVEAPHLAVVISGTLAGTEYCNLVSRNDWLAASPTNHVPGVFASFHRITPRKSWAFLPDLSSLLGAFVIVVSRPGGGIVAASGINLMRSANTRMSFHPLPDSASPATERQPALMFPVSMVEFEYSGFKQLGRTVEVPLVDRELFMRGFQDVPEGGRIVATLLEDAATFDAGPNLIREVCWGTHLEKFQALTAVPAWTTAPLYFAMFKDGIADLRNGVVLLEDGTAWGDSCVASIFPDLKVVDLDDYVGADSQLGWVGTGRQLDLGADCLAMMFTFTASRTNHAHWLMNSLLAVHYALPEIRSGRLILICPPLTDYRRGMLLKMGVPPAAILETDARYVTCRNLVFPSPLSTRANMHPSPSCLPMFRELRTLYARTYRQPMPALVMYTRNGYPSSRSMENENELIAALETLGFRCVAPHELSMEEEINVISRARIIVSQLGAALSNMPFAPPGCTIIEVGTDNYTSNEYLYIAHLLNQRFVRVMVEPLVEGFMSSSNFKFRAPIAAIEHIVRTIMGT
jgi:hypothetical protein